MASEPAIDYNTHIAYCFTNDNQAMKFGQSIEFNKRDIFHAEIMQKMRQGD